MADGSDDVVCPDASFVLDHVADDDRHPSTMLQTHTLNWRRLIQATVPPSFVGPPALHDDPAHPTVHTEATYLLRHLTQMAQQSDADIKALNRDTGACVAWLSRILDLGSPIEKGAYCPTCGVERVARPIGETTWTCPAPDCGITFTPEQYQRETRALVLDNATALSAVDLGTLLGVKASTLRQWAKRGHIDRQGHDTDGHPLYDVAQVRARVKAGAAG